VADVYASEEEQLQAIKDWFKEYGRYILLGLVIGGGGILAWNGWNAYQHEQALKASASYEALRSATKAGQTNIAQETGQQLLQEFPQTPYAAQTALTLANDALKRNDAETAQTHLQWLLDNAAEPFKHLARLRLARLQAFYQKDYSAALNTLQATGQASFEPLYDQLRGDIHLAQGDTTAARAAYQKALDGWLPEFGTSHLLRLKLNDIPKAPEQDAQS